ncbi:metallophosphoesterase [Bacteroides sp.]|uniref:metallophosphoesterase family protein n=1 Tax=Bacteroides sp. TaxID=29523 RepID=UPI00258FC0A8|nr:metallophosphoesterase [Bacteroides sp.]
MKYTVLYIAIFFLTGCVNYHRPLDEVSIAFVSDIHFRDLSAINDSSLQLSKMKDQIMSTRLFNENYYACFSTLDNIAERNIKIVVITGDLTDDSQKENVEGISRVLKYYEDKYNMKFFLMTGNHDPSRPFNYIGNNQVKLGYEDILKSWHDYGFFPLENYIYWESPYYKNDLNSYSYQLSSKNAFLHNRKYNIKGYNPSIVDASYLVEPVKGLWLLAIDASVYPPGAVCNDSIVGFKGASLGYNGFIHDKNHLLSWIKDVCNRARKYNKCLVAFSHYPMVDLYGYLSDKSKKIIYNEAEIKRIPKSHVSDSLADTGLKIHFGGHLHVNNTAVYTSEKGNSFVNIQVPSISGYLPAYKILHIKNKDDFDIETVLLDKVDKFDNFFQFYEKEYNATTENSWDYDIIKSSNYVDYVTSYFEELIKNRFIKEDYPFFIKHDNEIIYDLIKIKYGGDLAIEQLGNDKISNIIEIAKSDIASGSDSVINEYRLTIKDIVDSKYPDKDFSIHFNNNDIDISY